MRPGPTVCDSGDYTKDDQQPALRMQKPGTDTDEETFTFPNRDFSASQGP